MFGRKSEIQLEHGCHGLDACLSADRDLYDFIIV